MTVRKARSPEEVAAAFIASWNTHDAKDRLGLLREICDEDAVFVSPQGITVGCPDMSASIGAFLSAFPASKVLIGDVENNHGHLRFPWTTVFGDGRPGLSGDDYAVLDESGRIRLVASFDGHTRFP